LNIEKPKKIEKPYFLGFLSF